MKKLYKLFIILLMLCPVVISAEIKRGEYGNYEDAQKIVKEIMKSYYIRGPKIQYNYSKTNYPIGSPEEATSQDTLYSVCAAYTYSVYAEGFGSLNSESSPFPRYNYDISDYAADYYNNNIKQNKGDDGTFLIYYQNTTTNEKYVYSENQNNISDFEKLVETVKPGDIFVYSGHALIAYDVLTNPNTGKKDVLILNSTTDEIVRTRITGTSKIYYNLYKSPNGTNNVLDIDKEGTIQFMWLSSSSHFMKNGELNCSDDECGVIRIFYEKDGKAVFNYDIETDQYDKGMLRTNYPGIIIEKTVDKGDNNTIYFNDELLYTIKITNKSGVTGNPVTYDSFVIEEILDSKVDYISSTGSYANNSVKWTIDSLAANSSVEVAYKVKVKENNELNLKTIKSQGKFYSPNNPNVYLTTGTVNNLIAKVPPKVVKSFKTCYDENKDQYGSLELIDKVYECAYKDDYKISFSKDFNFDNLFVKKAGASPKVNSTFNLTESEKENPTFSKIILNNYANGIVKGNDGKYYFPRITSSSLKRAKTIIESDFKEGDVLIYYITNSTYTNEEGLYAYLYIDGKFIGVNGEENTVRNEFSHNYYSASYDKLYVGHQKLTPENKDKELTFINYQTLFGKDYYAIFRPTLSFEYKEETKEEIDEKEEPKEEIENEDKVEEEIKEQEKIENPNTGNNLKYSAVTMLLMISASIYFVIRKKTKFKKHC